MGINNEIDDQKNAKKRPRRIWWREDEDGCYPYCPACKEMPYSTKQCLFCGQRFVQDEMVAWYNTPAKKVELDCPICGGKGTLVGENARSNGHFHGKCTECGACVIE